MADRRCAVSAWPTADEITLQSISAAWGTVYDCGYAHGVYWARRHDAEHLLSAGTPAGLESAIRADYARWTAR